MFKQTRQKTLSWVVALAMVPASFVPQISFADGQGETCKPKAACDSAVAKFRSADATAGKAAPSSGITKPGEQLKLVSSTTSQLACSAKTICEEQKSKCESESKSNSKTCDVKKCEALKKAVVDMSTACTTNAAAGLEAGKSQSASGAQSGSGSGSSEANKIGGGKGLLAGMDANTLLPFAMAGAMIGMAMSQGGGDEAPMQQMPYNGALLSSGALDCSKPDAIVYRGCVSNIETRCLTTMEDPFCQSFSAHHCGPEMTGGATVIVQPQTPSGIQVADPINTYSQVGEGKLSPYCQSVVAWNWCKQGGRDLCPSCQQLQRNFSAGCAKNPASCLAQNSTTALDAAKSTCPDTDPIYASPAYVAAVQQNPVAGEPAVVLPQSANGGRGVGGIGGVAGSREVAAVGTGMRTMSARGPAPDIEGKYGQNLFSTSSQAIRQRCQDGLLNNCR